MKILVGSFQCESNSFCDSKAGIRDFEVYEGGDVIRKLAACKVFEEAGASIVPLIFASGLPSGEVTREAFEHFKNIFVERIRQVPDADGIYLYLHGSMYVEDLGSGEEWLVKAIREVTGMKMPITVCMDFHANLSDGFIRNVNGIQGFRTAPHVDQDDTECRAAESLLKCIRAGKHPVPRAVHIPFLGGDACVTSREPFVSVTEVLRQLDAREDVVSCALFNAQPWYDADYAGACAVVSTLDDQGLSEALELAKMFWDGKEQLTLDGAMGVDDAVNASLAHEGEVLFVTDSGDNTTAGAYGRGTLLLKKYLEREAKGVLVCGIMDQKNTDFLLTLENGSSREITLCEGRHAQQEIELKLQVTLKGRGKVYGWAGDEVGEGVLLSTQGPDVVLTNARAAFTTPEHFIRMGIKPKDYRVVVLKMGYLFPKLHAISDETIFALTPGQSTNDFGTLKFRRLTRKMYPIHTDITWESIHCRAAEAANVIGEQTAKEESE